MRNKGTIIGICGLFSAVAGGCCWWVSALSPAILWVTYLVLQLLALLLMIGAGIISSRWWLAVVVLPLYFLWLSIPLYERKTEITLKGDTRQGIVFKLSGTFTVPSLYIDRYSADLQGPDDRRYQIWQIQAADRRSGGELASVLGSVKYGIVPSGYIQVFPPDGLSPAPLESGKIYHVSDGGSFRRYFEIVDNEARWVKNPPEEPCFTRRQDRWVRIGCSP